MRKRFVFVLAALAVSAALPAPALAGVSVAGGGFVQGSPSASGPAAILSTTTAVPTVPLAVGGSVFVPLASNGGYAVTAEVRGLTGGGYGGGYVGGGIGIGNLGGQSYGTVVTLFVGKPIAPLTSIELRLYKQTESGGATAGFVGLRFSL